MRFKTALALLAIALCSTTTAWSVIDRRVRAHVALAMENGLDPVDFAHLVFAFSWRGSMTDRRQLEDSLDHLQGLRQIDPLMQAELDLIRSRLAVEGGNAASARSTFTTMGGLQHWWTTDAVKLGELEDFTALATHPAADTVWRPVHGTGPLGWVRLRGLAWPAHKQILYLTTTVFSPRKQDIALSVGLAQVGRIWLNGEEILTTPHPLRRAEDQIIGGGQLMQGNNTIVVAVASESTDWWLRLRLSAPNGQYLGEEVSEIDSPPVLRRAPASAPVSPRSIESELREAVDRGREDAALALAAFLVMRHPHPVDSGEALSACQQARQEAPVESRWLEWLATTEATRARTLLEEALQADSDFVWARTELVRWYHRRGLDEIAGELVRNAPSPSPFLEAVRLDLDANRWGPLVIADLEALVRSNPGCSDAALILAERAIDANRWPLARRIVDDLDTRFPGLRRLEDLRETLASTCGDVGALRSLLADGLADDQNRLSIRIRLARLLIANSERVGARELLAQGLERCPEHPDLLLELARLNHLEGNEAGAAELLERVLTVRPQDQRAQRLLVLVGGEQEDQSWRRSVEELRKLARKNRSADAAVALVNHIEIEFLPRNLTEERVQQVYLVSDPERADRLLAFPLPYVPERQRLRILAARVIKADGSEVSARQNDTPRLAEPEINLYYDTRLRVLRFSKFEPGDLIEIAYILTETAESNETGAFQGGIVDLSLRVATSLTELSLSAPEELLPAWQLANLEGQPASERTMEGMRTLSWRWTSIAAQSSDQPPPPRNLVQPQLVYSNHESWAELADWYQRHIGIRTRASRQVEEKAAELIESVPDRLRRIARIYRFVTDEIRYVGLEFGEHRYRPFSANWVLNHRIGDCKDKAALLVALYSSVGIPARMVMLRTTDLGPVATTLPVLQYFNHAIVYLPEDNLWLDGTAAGHSPYPPPLIDQGAWALVVRGGESSPEYTPQPGGGLSTLEYDITPQDAGTIEIRLRSEDSGDAAVRRRHYFSGSMDPLRFASWLQSQFPGARLIETTEIRLRPGQSPAILDITGEIEPTALVAAGGIPTFPGGFDWISEVVPGGQRQTPLVVVARPDLKWRLRVRLDRPARHLPEDSMIETPFGRLELDFEAIEMGYELNGFFHLEAGLVTAQEATELREFLVSVGRLMSRPLEAP